MEFKIRPIGRYKDISVSLGNTKVELGLCDADECMAIAEKLKSALQDLLEKEEYETLIKNES